MEGTENRLDEARGKVLDRVESGRKMMVAAMAGAAILEAAMLVGCIALVDWKDRTEVLLLLIFLLSYFIVMLGFVALAGHITRSTARVLAVLQAQRDEVR